MEVKGSETQSEKNVISAFEEEARACLRYSIYAQAARDEGQIEIARLFSQMEQEERGHALAWYKLYHKKIGDSQANLKIAARSENEEWKKTYPVFAQQARVDGFEELAEMFERIASIEYAHERRFTEELLRIESGEILSAPSQKKAEEDIYCCVICGYCSAEKRGICPVCLAENAFSE